MPKRPDALKTLQLSLELLRRIPKRGTVTATELRLQLKDAGFGREPRTIQRLLETLCDSESAFNSIERDDSSKPYRYRWKENAKGFSLPGLSTQESLLLTLAEQQLSSLLPFSARRAASCMRRVKAGSPSASASGWTKCA
jgi:hypothetical protein